MSQSNSLNEVGNTELEDTNMEDLFHMVVPIIIFDGNKLAFTEDEEYETFEEEVPKEGRKIVISWSN